MITRSHEDGSGGRTFILIKARNDPSLEQRYDLAGGNEYFPGMSWQK